MFLELNQIPKIACLDLAIPPKVGRTTKNHSSSSNPAPVLADAAYEMPYIPKLNGLEKL